MANSTETFPESVAESSPDTSPKGVSEKETMRGKSPESQKNLRKGKKPSPREEEAVASGHPLPEKPPKAVEPVPELEQPDPGPVAIEEGMPEMLWWMNHVLKRPERTDVEEGQKACRKWLRENVSAFMAARTKLESDWLEYKKAKVLAAAPREEEEVDEPLERVIDGPRLSQVRALLHVA